MTATILQTSGLCIGYAPKRRPRIAVAADIGVELLKGELVCLLGPNGAGKSTLMRTLAGLQKPLAGEVLLKDRDLHGLTESERARLLGLVLTERMDVGNLSAYALVALGRYPYTGWDGRLSSEDEEVVRWAIDAVGARDLAARSVGELSDGERQKVMIARALAQEPAVLLLDEPTAFLDLPRRVEIVQLLRRLAGDRDRDRAVLLSTHDLDLALRCADRLWLLPQDGPLQTGAPEDLVLSGAFQQAFADVEFDPAIGSFHLAQEPEGSVGLVGEGLHALWTARALERAGFSVAEDAPMCVEIIHDNDDTVWRLHTAADQRVCTTLYELVKCLKLDAIN